MHRGGGAIKQDSSSDRLVNLRFQRQHSLSPNQPDKRELLVYRNATATEECNNAHLRAPVLESPLRKEGWVRGLGRSEQ